VYDLFNKNKGLAILRQINAVLLDENVQLDDIYQNQTILSCFKYDPITSVDVNRSFSVLRNNMLTDNVINFTEDKLEMCMVIHFNNK